MSAGAVTLLRRFLPADARFEEWDFLALGDESDAKRWHEIHALRRVLIIADPGAGKTYEALDAARRLRERGKPSFFIRIEAIDGNFADAFEVGTAEEYRDWLASTQQGWFFLDSVDEAQLETPRALEVAVQLFGAAIHPALDRVHIVLTSREDAWQALADRTLIEQHLPFGNSAETEDETGAENAEPLGRLSTFLMAALDDDEIRLFAAHHGVSDPDEMLAAIDRANLRQMAERPFDLKAIIAKWKADRTLGSRLEVLDRTIALQLAEAKGLDGKRGRNGARALAAAVTMTGEARISVPGVASERDCIDPTHVLQDWSGDEIEMLLRTGVFDDIVYGSARVRHREIRELLTAEWAHSLILDADSRRKVEDLFFRESYGEAVIVPRLRPTLSWLILLDGPIRDRALALAPEIAAEGGDPSRLPLDVRRSMLGDIVERISRDGSEEL